MPFLLKQWIAVSLFFTVGFVNCKRGENINLNSGVFVMDSSWRRNGTSLGSGQDLYKLCGVRLEFFAGENGAFGSLNDLETFFSGHLPDELELVIHSLLQNTLNFRILLQRNRDLLAQRYQHRHYKFGQVQIGRDNIGSKKKECNYHGFVEGDSFSHAAVNFCYGQIDGIIYVHGVRYVVESKLGDSTVIGLVPASQYWDDTWTDLSVSSNNDDRPPEITSPSCDFPSSLSSHDKNDLSQNSFSRVKRGAKVRNKTRRVKPTPAYYSGYLDGVVRYVELVIVNDNSVYRKFNFDKELVEVRSRQIANIINALYFPLNIRVALVGVETWTEGDRITVPNDGDHALQNFLRYRNRRLNINIPNDNAQLLTNQVFKSGVVGKALKGTMCSYERSGGVNLDHSRRVVSIASTVAHEMGHNFGMEHDNDTCDCPQNERCIMSASSGGLAPTYWSSCSLEYLSWGLQHGSDYCLKNVPEVASIFEGPVCGNGLKEEGEECDCGFPNVCKDPCCNASTCKLVEGAECANGECCDRSACKVKKATTVCRAQNGDCDLAEYCDGKSEQCPADVFKQDGILSDQGYCFNGKCGSRDGQCSLLWGDTGYSSPDICYQRLNRHKNVHGNCGYDRRTLRYSSCSDKDVMCGRLHCVHKNEKTEFGDRAVVQTAHTFLQQIRGQYAVCRVAQYDLGGVEDRDPGMVPNGAKCGVDKMCLNSGCAPVEKVLNILPCDPPDCNGVGVCNSKGHCHCDFGYGGLGCESSGLGGSVDSGPSGPAGGFNVLLAVLIFVLVIFPLLTAILTFLYRKKRHWLTKYKILRYFLPKRECKGPRLALSSSCSSTNSSPSHRLVFAAKPPPINGIPISEAQELERSRRQNRSLAVLEMPPGYSPVSPTSPTAASISTSNLAPFGAQNMFTANTLPRPHNIKPTRDYPPSQAPPPPPKRAPLVEADSAEEDEENYYDVIPTPPEEIPPFGKKRPSYGLVDKPDVVKLPLSQSSWAKKPPLPVKPPVGRSSEDDQKSESRVSALRAKFDQKSGSVKSSLVK